MHFVIRKCFIEKYKFFWKCNSFQCKFRYVSTRKNILNKGKDVPSVLLQDKYLPQEVEHEWYKWWELRKFFKPKSETDCFAILLPPPNVTGTLHLGHAFTLTIQDVILRWMRMNGKSVVWVPGIDHAGIATQTVVEKHLSETLGLSKHSLGREEFLKRVEEWKSEKEKHIIGQLKKMGASVDWDRMIYTMDPVHSHLVRKCFIQLYNDGLIYRKRDLVNWSFALKSSVSDIEVDYVLVGEGAKLNVPGYEKPVQFGLLYDIAYKVCDEDEEIIVSTTRPETMLGDVAIAVHPESPSHSRFLNKYVWHPFRNERIPVIGDGVVDPCFGTGAVKITPAHSLVDHEVGLRHGLGAVDVFDEDGVMRKVGSSEEFVGMRRYDGRSAIVEELSRLGLFRGCKGHATKIPICSRSGDVIEWVLKSQWFLKCGSLAQKAVEAAREGEIKFEPKSYCNVWIDWLETKSLRDWNLSRQLWWGHRIPMYDCRFEGEQIWMPSTSLQEAKAEAAKVLGAPPENVEAVQDPDVLDTWFSSALLPLNPMLPRSPRRNAPPISLMVTGHDILFFWVARMVMLSTHLSGELPFRNVLLHGLVCDAKGKKMSKSLGNVVSPEDIINGLSLEEMKKKLEKDVSSGVLSRKQFEGALSAQRKMFPAGIPECGVDGLRFTLCSSHYQSERQKREESALTKCARAKIVTEKPMNILSGAFINFDIDLCRSSRFFCNKVYQAMNYFTRITEKYKLIGEFDLADLQSDSEREKLNLFDKWILSRLQAVVSTVNDGFSSYTFSVGTAAIRSFVVQDFCSNYLESSKAILENSSPLQYKTTISVFYHCLETSLRLLAPLMPFLSEHLYQALPPLKGSRRCDSVTAAPFPKNEHWQMFRDDRLERNFVRISSLLSVLRKGKLLLRLRETKPDVFVECSDEVAEILFGEMSHVFSKMAGVGQLARGNGSQRQNVMRQKVSHDCTAFLQHHYKKETLVKLLSGITSKEDSLRKSLEKLELELEAKKLESTQRNVEDRIRINKINSLKLELEKINELKDTIEQCSV